MRLAQKTFVVPLVLAVAALSASLGDGRVAAQADQSAVSGRVVQGTVGAPVPEGLQVVLLTVDAEKGEIVERTTTNIDGEGRFAFSNLLKSPDYSYFVAANTEGAYAPQVDLTGLEDWSDVELKIYESTQSLDAIRVTTFSLLVPSVDPRTRSMGVLAVVNILNSGDRVWQVDLQKPGLTGLDMVRFSVPEGYRDLSVESDLPAGNTMEIPTGFAITNPVPPGEYNLLMTYVLDYKSDSVSFPLRLPFGADLVRVLLREGQGTLAGDNLGNAESVVLNDAVYQAVEGRDFARDTVLDISFGGLPQPTFWQSATDFFEGRTYILIIVWVVAVVLLGILVYSFIRSRGRKLTPAVAGASGTAIDHAVERQRIVAEIAALDDEHAAGRVPDADYQARRDALKQQALKLGRATTQGSSSQG